MLNAAIEYLEMGFSVIPVRPENKQPYIKWTEYQKRLPTIEELESWWAKYPKANVAIITGKISGLFIFDADGPKGIEWININLPKTSVYSKTFKGLHSVYLIPDDITIKNKVRFAPEVDIRGEGGYIVAPPSIHESGHKYEWIFLMDGWDDLTKLDPYSIVPKQNGNLNIDLGCTKTLPINEGVDEGNRNNTLTELVGKWINLDLDDEEVTILAKNWNQKNSPPLPEQELMNTIKSIRNIDNRNHPKIGVTPYIEPADINENSSTIPPEVLKPGGTLQEMMDYIETNSTVSVPIFSLAASISSLGNIMGQKVQTETGLRTNIYSISLGYSGTGKNAPFNTLPQLIGKSKAHEILGPTELTSSTAVLKWLSVVNHRVTYMMLDEIGLVLKGLKKPESHAADIPRLFTKLFSSTDRSEIKSYASGDTIAVPWHHLSFYGASTPDRFWESIGGGEVADGFLARVLIFESRHDSPMPKSTISFSEKPELIEKMNRIYSIEVKTDSSRGNIELVPIPIIIPRTTDAGRYFEDWAEKYHLLKNEHKTDSIASIYGRAAEHAAKLALIHAVSLNLDKTKAVDIESSSWACLLVDHLIENIVTQIKENVADTDVQRWKQKILKGIKQMSKKRHYKGATLRDIQRGPCQGLLSADVKKYLDSLILSEEIGVNEYTTQKNRKVKFFYLS